MLTPTQLKLKSAVVWMKRLEIALLKSSGDVLSEKEAI